MQDVAKEIRLTTDESGICCKCLNQEGFKYVTLDDRKLIISIFSPMKSYKMNNLTIYVDL